MRIRAAVLHEPGDVRIEDVELDAPRAGEVLVRVAAAGVCHSDLHLVNGALGEGRWPMVLGHEGAGVVEALGEGVTSFAVGDPVALCFVPPCGACAACLAGRRNLCEQAAAASLRGTLLDGTSRLRASDGTPLQHGLMTACFAEPRGGRRERCRAAARRSAALAGRAARVRRDDRLRRRPQRRPCPPGRERRRGGCGRGRAPGDRRREACRRGSDRRGRSRRGEARHSRSSVGPITPSTRRRRSASSGRSGR